MKHTLYHLVNLCTGEIVYTTAYYNRCKKRLNAVDDKNKFKIRRQQITI